MAACHALSHHSDKGTEGPGSNRSGHGGLQDGGVDPELGVWTLGWKVDRGLE